MTGAFAGDGLAQDVDQAAAALDRSVESLEVVAKVFIFVKEAAMAAHVAVQFALQPGETPLASAIGLVRGAEQQASLCVGCVGYPVHLQPNPPFGAKESRGGLWG